MCRLISVAIPSGCVRSGSAPLQRSDGAVEHFGEQIETDFLHFAGLVVAEHLAGTAVSRSCIARYEAGASSSMAWMASAAASPAWSRPPSSSVRQQVGVGLVVRTTDAAAQLVQLGARPNFSARLIRMVLACGLSMPVSMIVVHSSRLARCWVKSRITRSSSRSFIWPWPTTMRASGTSSQLFAHVLDGVDLVVQEIHLATALEFAQHRFADDAVGEAGDKGLDRQPLLRCRGNDREIAQAFERHGQVRGIGVAVSVQRRLRRAGSSVPPSGARQTGAPRR